MMDKKSEAPAHTGRDTCDRERIFQRMSALELGRGSMHGPILYVACALFTVLGSSIRTDYPLASLLVLVSLAVLAIARIRYARGFEDRYDRVGVRAVRDFSLLLPAQCSVFSWSGFSIIVHYGESAQSMFRLLFVGSPAAAGTSSLAPRSGVHRVFVVVVMAPLVAALVPGLGQADVVLLFGTLALLAFYLREGTLASKAYRGLIATQIDLEDAALQIRTYAA